jgi:ATP phosphoribosyltransferase regulatory subunit
VRQAGLELVGASGPAADAEVIALLVTCLRAAGCADVRVAVGSVAVTEAVLAGAGVSPRAAGGLRAALAARSLVAWRGRAARSGVRGPAGGLLSALPSLRGGTEVLERVASVIPGAADACAGVARALELAGAHGVGDALMVDLGVMRDWPYYSGVVLEAYSPRVGEPVAVGGRYDGLGARFGCPRPAVGVAITLDVLHRAVAAAAGPRALRRGVVMSGGLEAEVAAARAVRGSGLPVIALADGEDPERLAAADGWRWAARPHDGAWEVLDRESGERSAGSLGEVAATWGP